MRRLVRGCLIAVTAIIVGVGTALFVVYRAAHVEPAFYRQALQAEPAQLAAAGDELEQDVLELRNETRDEGQWEAEFTDQQINGWLAVDLPEKFPDLLPNGVESPRVQISNGELSIAARYRDSMVDSVVSIVLNIALTDEPNTVAVTIQGIRAGAIPIPTRQFLDRIAETARQGDVPLRWAQQDEQPVALLTIPAADGRDHRQVLLDRIELRVGAIVVAGRTESNRTPTRRDIAQRPSTAVEGENVTSQ